MTDLIGASLDSRYVCQSGADFNLIKLGRHKTEKRAKRVDHKNRLRLTKAEELQLIEMFFTQREQEEVSAEAATAAHSDKTQRQTEGSI